jgi:2-aminoethylphosphonate-pyruvate transaminase
MKSHHFLKTTHKLFCPGPVNVAENVRQAVATFEIGHREKEFSYLLKSINSKLLDVFEIKEQSKFQPVIITGSGSAANEAVLSSMGERPILIISNGEFGERLAKISAFYNVNTHHIKYEWGQAFDLREIEKYLKSHQIELLAVVHHETSIGMLNPIYKLGTLSKKYGFAFIIDTVSSAGAEKIDLEKANVAFCTSSSSKAIGSLPGVSFVIGKKSEFTKLKNIPAKTIYLSLYNFYKYATEKLQTPNTPAVQSFIGLNQALENILAEGVSKRHKHIKKMTLMLRKGMEEHGFYPIIDKSMMSSVLTTIEAPVNFDIEEFKLKLRERDIIIYSGKGPLEGRVFQVGNIGNLNTESVKYFLTSMKECLEEMGYFALQNQNFSHSRSQKVVAHV